MSAERSTWVGTLDLDGGGAVTRVNGALQTGHTQARLLARFHGAPLGYVCLPTQPAESLAARALALAGETFAATLDRHAVMDSSAITERNPHPWASLMACPRHYACFGGIGITVVICTRDRTDSLRESLATLRQANYEPIEFLVVDNAPSQATTRELVTGLAREDTRIRYTCEPLPGLSRARNHALRKARYDIVAFTDDDTLADPGWPAALAAGFMTDPATVCVTGLVMPSALDTASERYFDARYGSSAVFEARRFDLAGHRHQAGLYPFNAGVFGTGANFAVRRSAITGLGGFDPLLGAGGPGRGGEDLDLFLRVILAGGRICYVPTAIIWHRHRTDTRALGDQVYSYGHGLGAYLAKHCTNHELRAALLKDGLGQARALMGRMRHASTVSQLGLTGARLALSETSGVVAGALRYWRAKRALRSAVPSGPS